MSKKIDSKDNLVLLEMDNDEKYYIFHPNIFHLFPKSGDTRIMDWTQRIRFLIMLFNGYRVYIVTDVNDVVKGSITISNGGSFRFPFTTKRDLIDGPSFTVPEYRKQGVASRLGNKIMNKYEKEYDTMYGVINENNHASIERCKKNGYRICGKVKLDMFHRYVMSSSGNVVLVAYDRKG